MNLLQIDDKYRQVIACQWRKRIITPRSNTARGAPKVPFSKLYGTLQDTYSSGDFCPLVPKIEPCFLLQGLKYKWLGQAKTLQMKLRIAWDGVRCLAWGAWNLWARCRTDKTSSPFFLAHMLLARSARVIHDLPSKFIRNMKRLV